MLSQVDDSVWRGPRPQPAYFGSIQAQFATIISLEGSAEDTKEKGGMPKVQFIDRSITTIQIYVSGISQAFLSQIISDIRTAKKPVLVHCQHGEDRTGLVIGAYRVRNGWTKDAAWDEMLKFGYRSWLNFGLNHTWKNMQGFKGGE